MTTVRDDLPHAPSARTGAERRDGSTGRAGVDVGARRVPADAGENRMIAGAPPGRRPHAGRSRRWRRRRLLSRLCALASVVLAGLWVATSLAPGLLPGWQVPLLDRVVAGHAPRPTPEVAALADQMFLTEKGRALLFATRPEMLGAAEFAGRCEPVTPRAPGTTGSLVGCYRTLGGVTGGARIVVYAPADVRLRDFMVTTVAHELLHAAWDDLAAAERTAATTALEAALRGVPPDDELHARLAGSVGTHAAGRPTELFAYIGTQVWEPGGLDPALEEVYGRYVADREALVGVHARHTQLIATLTADLTAAQQALGLRRHDQALDAAQLEADAADLERYRQVIEQEESRLAAQPGSRSARALLSWTWRDGTRLSEAPPAELLAEARALLARDEADVAARRAALQGGEAAVAGEETRVAELRADLAGVLAQLQPDVG